MSYLNVDEVESALVALARAYPGLCELITLPYKTFEDGLDGKGRAIHALRIGEMGPHDLDGVLFTGCVHAREWGGADICVYFAADLLEAYKNHTGLVYGGKTFTPAEIELIFKHRNVFVFPDVNPDGRAHSQAAARYWRPNRNPVAGVDINRNHDFMWDISRYFHPAVADSVASTKPGDDTYHGSGPASEPETLNIDWLFDTYPRIAWYMDIHCYAQELVYSWGTDTNQSTDPSMNFQNPVYHRQRGLDGDAYEEFIPAPDLKIARDAAWRVRWAMKAVRGTDYLTRQGFYMLTETGHPIPYPTSGAGDDYAYSRHFVNPSKSKVLAYTLEYSPKYWNPGISNPFNPDWSVMEETIRDVNAGMVQFCIPELVQIPLPPKSKRLFPWDLWGPFLVGLLAGVVIYRLGEQISKRGQRGH